MAAFTDSQRRAALSTKVPSTGLRSVGELAITRKISLVAVCCSRASLSWRLRSCNSLAVALSRFKDSPSFWRSSAIVSARLAGEVFAMRRRGLAFLFVAPFLVVIAIKKDRCGSRKERLADFYFRWLVASTRKFNLGAGRFALVLQPWPSEQMQAHEVSTLVNSPENDSAECIQAVSPGQRGKSQLPLLCVSERPDSRAMWRCYSWPRLRLGTNNATRMSARSVTAL